MKYQEITPEDVSRIVSGHLSVRKTVSESSGEHAIADCPLCGKTGHFYINLGSGLWDCKRCGESGNLYSLGNALGVRVREPSLVKSASSLLRGGKPKPGQKGTGFPLERAIASSERLFDPADREGSEVLSYLMGRGFSEEAIRRFRLGAVHLPGGELGVGIPYIVGDRVELVKMRNLVAGKSEDGRKRRFARTKGSASLLFNAEHIRDAKRVVLVEGELDAVSLWQLGITTVAATSLGAKSKLPREWIEALASAEDIVLLYDNDEAGSEAVAGLVEQLGTYRTRIASFDSVPELRERYLELVKDANDLLGIIHAGEEEETVRTWARRIIERARGMENERIQRPSAYADHVAEEINRGEQSLGISTGWPGLDKLLRGWRTPELTVITGHTGHGKSTWALAAAAHLAGKGEAVLTSAFENGPSAIARKLFQQKYGRPISSISSDIDRERAFEVLARLDEDPIYVLDIYGQSDLGTILDGIKYARTRLGVRFVLLDHLHFFLKRPHGQEEREYIDEVLMALVKATRELDVHIWLVGHPRGAVDQTTIPTGDSMKGSSSIKQIADNGITVYRPVDMQGDPTPRRLSLRDAQGRKVDLELSPLNSLVYVWKARHDDAREGSVILDFNSRNLRYTEPRVAVSAYPTPDPRVPDDDAGAWGLGEIEDLFPN